MYFEGNVHLNIQDLQICRFKLNAKLRVISTHFKMLLFIPVARHNFKLSIETQASVVCDASPYYMISLGA